LLSARDGMQDLMLAMFWRKKIAEPGMSLR